MKIPYAIDLSVEDGADSVVGREGDHADSPYFAHPDVYNMESTDTLTVLHNFKTSSRPASGPAASARPDGAGVVRQAGRLERRNLWRRCATLWTARSWRAIPAPP